MGLDISVRRPLMPTPENLAKADDWRAQVYMTIVSGDDGDNTLSCFKEFLFVKEFEYLDFEAAFKNLGLNFEHYSWVCSGMATSKHTNPEFWKDREEKEDEYWYTFRDTIDDTKYVWFENDTIPKVKQDRICILSEEVGYQRKGANNKFYEDDKWGNPAVIDSKTLHEHWEKYFSHKTPDSPGGFGSGVEYDQEDTVMRNNFKRNIIDKFVEGETWVVYC